MVREHPCTPAVEARSMTAFGPSGTLSAKSSNGYTIYASHVYVVHSISTTTGLVCLHNPWDDLMSDKFLGKGVVYLTMPDFKKFFNDLWFGVR